MCKNYGKFEELIGITKCIIGLGLIVDKIGKVVQYCTVAVTFLNYDSAAVQIKIFIKILWMDLRKASFHTLF